MNSAKKIGKREFIQQTSKYIKWVEKHNAPLIISHHNHPSLVLTKISGKSIKDLRGIAKVIIHGDINDPIFPGYDQW